MFYAIKLWLAVVAVGLPTAFLFRSAFKELLSPRDYAAAWAILGAGTTVAFLAQRTEVFILLLFGVSWVANRSLAQADVGRVAILILLGTALPAISWSPSGFGDINRLLEIDVWRALTLGTLLLPAFRLAAEPQRELRKSRWLDRAVLAYVIVRLLFNFSDSSATSLIRQLSEALLDTLLPYFVISRGLRTERDLRHALSFFAITCLFASAVALAELTSGHLFYSGLQFIYDIRWQLTLELFRGSLIRSQAMTPQPILFAVLLTFGLAAWVVLQGARWRRPVVAMVFVLLLAALLSTGSRGPLVGAVLFFACLLLLRFQSGSAFGLTLGLFLAAAVIAKVLGWDEAAVKLLHAVFGKAEAEGDSIDYRRMLFETGIELIKQQPWWGVSNYAAHMEHLRQGEGIIDLVNTYLAVALETGVVGLVFFVAPYAVAMGLLGQTLTALRAQKRQVLGEFAPVWLALIASVLLTLFSTSVFGVLSVALVVLLALSAAWADRVAAPVGPAEPAEHALSQDAF
jgi:hypothetical protein